MSRPLGYLARRHWGSLPQALPPGLLLPAQDGLANHQHWPYTWGNRLSINRWCNVRPLQWGVSAPSPTCTFSSDVVLRGPAPALDWYAHLGDTTYYERASTDVPYVVVAYAPFAVNVIHQHLQLQQPAVLTQTTAQVVIGSSPNFGAPHALAAQPSYSAELMVFQPCTIMSYLADQDQVTSIVIQPQNVDGGIGALRRVAYYSSAIIPYTGLTIGDVVDATAVYRMQGRPAGMRRPTHQRPSATEGPPAKKSAGNA